MNSEIIQSFENGNSTYFMTLATYLREIDADDYAQFVDNHGSATWCLLDSQKEEEYEIALNKAYDDYLNLESNLENHLLNFFLRNKVLF